MSKKETKRSAEHDCTDAANRDRFVKRERNGLKYLKEEKAWVAWDGTRWADKKVRVYDRAIKTATSIYREAEASGDKQDQGYLSRWAKASQSKDRIEAMLKLSSEDLAASVTEFDTDSHSINSKNGIVNLKTGELTKHDPSQLVRKRVNAPYNPASACERWRQFLREVFLDDEELIDWMQRALGYATTGLVSEQSMFFLYGGGENGKTIFSETILKILGNYAGLTPFETFLRKDKNVRDLEAVGALKGLRFVVSSESGGTRGWDETLLKKATGEDTMQGAKLYGHKFDFQPTHTLFFLSNHLPSFKDGSHGMKRRFRIIPFKAQFSGEQKDKKLLSKLLAEREGIFAWLVEGAKAYFARGLDDVPKAIAVATESYIEDNDPLGAFIKEQLVKDPRATVGVDETYKRYQRWCEPQSIDPGPLNFFPQNMLERGVERKRTNKGRVFVGYRFTTGQPNAATHDIWENKNETGIYVLKEPVLKKPQAKPTLEEFRRMSETQKNECLRDLAPPQ